MRLNGIYIPFATITFVISLVAFLLVISYVTTSQNCHFIVEGGL